jgi:uncharacterized protein YbjT (DUF2867 family)
MNEKHVIFGSGPLGLSVMRALAKRGKSVNIVNRSGTLGSSLPANVEVVAGDAYDINFTANVTTGAAAIYQCAQPSYFEWVTKFPRLQNSMSQRAVLEFF